MSDQILTGSLLIHTCGYVSKMVFKHTCCIHVNHLKWCFNRKSDMIKWFGLIDLLQSDLNKATDKITINNFYFSN